MTTPPCREILAKMRDTFPAPVSDRMHDAYFVFSIMRALDQVDAMKSEVPLLGQMQELDYTSAEQMEFPEHSRRVEDVDLVQNQNVLDARECDSRHHLDLTVTASSARIHVVGSSAPPIEALRRITRGPCVAIETEARHS